MNNENAIELKSNNEKITPKDYFGLAKSWADDFYTTMEISRNRWKALCLYILLPIVFILLICVASLAPNQHFLPVLVTHYENGLETLTPFKEPYTPDVAQVKSDINRYVTFRESYSSSTYDYSYRLINLLSSNDVANTYNQDQSSKNNQSPINVLGNKGYTTVKIDQILILDSEDKNNSDRKDQHHTNLAQVDFIVSEHDKSTGAITSTPYSALVSWQYKGSPKNPADQWENWNGFTVTNYQLQQRNS